MLIRRRQLRSRLLHMANYGLLMANERSGRKQMRSAIAMGAVTCIVFRARFPMPNGLPQLSSSAGTAATAAESFHGNLM
jgi:hypothetical protein